MTDEQALYEQICELDGIELHKDGDVMELARNLRKKKLVHIGGGRGPGGKWVRVIARVPVRPWKP